VGKGKGYAWSDVRIGKKNGTLVTAAFSEPEEGTGVDGGSIETVLAGGPSFWGERGGVLRDIRKKRKRNN